jgi:hypothetical protein
MIVSEFVKALSELFSNTVSYELIQLSNLHVLMPTSLGVINYMLAPAMLVPNDCSLSNSNTSQCNMMPYINPTPNKVM